MKYIANDCLIMAVEKEDEYNYYGRIASLKNFTKGYGSLLKSAIFKKADTIEELCDEFVLWHKNEYNIIDKCDLEDIREEYRRKESMTPYDNIYGSIWTDKGLIYVAKMNDEGELELL